MHTFFDEFEYTGHWWLSDDDPPVTGTVRYRRDDLYLELVGTLHPERGRTEETMRPRVIRGRATGGEQITLLNCSEDGWSTSTSGIPQSTYRASHLLIGKHYHDIDEMTFREFWLDYTRLEDWMWRERPSFDMETDEDVHHRFEEIRITIKSPLVYRARVPALGVEVALEGNYGLSGSLPYPEWSYRATLKLRADEEHTYGWWNDMCHDMQNLLTLLTGDVVFPRRIVGFPAEPYSVDEPELIEIFYPDRHWKRENLPNSLITLIDFTSVNNDFGNILERWFATVEERRPIYALHFGSYYNPESYLNYLFLGEMQVLESYLRERSGNAYLSPQEYQVLKAAIKQALPTTVSDEFKSILFENVKRSNEGRLQGRIETELDSWSRDLRKYVAHGSRFARVMVKTRNHWTHIGERDGDVLTDQHELHHAFEVLRLFITVLLLKDLGFSEERIIHYFEENPHILSLFRWHAWWRW